MHVFPERHSTVRHSVSYREVVEPEYDYDYELENVIDGAMGRCDVRYGHAVGSSERTSRVAQKQIHNELCALREC